MVAAAFFPTSLPNETVSSRIGRYHILSSNRTSAATYEQLGFPMAGADHIVSPYLEAMASQLPGDPATNFVNLIEQNTLLPFFKPFLGKRSSAADKSDVISRMPRRVVGNHGESYLCIDCIKEAKEEFGFGYWIRSHQIPGVSACWKHGCELVSSCPRCHFPFQRRGSCLSAPWHPCKHCSLEIENIAAVTASPHEVNYANYAHDLLRLNMDPIPPDTLSQLYRARIQQLGFIRGAPSNTAKGRKAGTTAMKKFTEDLIQFFGEKFIFKVDKAYATGRTSFWLRFSIIDGVMDMPLPRHILLGIRLFGNAATFCEAVHRAGRADVGVISPAKGRLLTTNLELRDKHRARITKEIKRHGVLQLEDLWRRALRATSWLVENDREWLDRTTSLEAPLQNISAKEDAELAEKDKHYAAQVEARSRELMAQKGRPVCATIGRLLATSPISASHFYLHQKELPLLAQQLALSRESTWCLRARRVLWAIAQVQEIGATGTASSIPSISSVSYYAVKRIIEFTRWDIEALSNKELNISSELARAGITPSWQGPGEVSAQDVGGRAYTPSTMRRHNRDTTLLRPGVPGEDRMSVAHPGSD